MASSQPPDSEQLKHDIDEATRHVSRVMSRMLKIIDSELRQSGINPEDFDIGLKQAEQEQAKRRAKLDSEHEQSKQKLLKKWKRY